MNQVRVCLPVQKRRQQLHETELMRARVAAEMAVTMDNGIRVNWELQVCEAEWSKLKVRPSEGGEVRQRV